MQQTFATVRAYQDSLCQRPHPLSRQELCPICGACLHHQSAPEIEAARNMIIRSCATAMAAATPKIQQTFQRMHKAVVKASSIFLMYPPPMSL
eukprot:1143678-Pelagomonas_calceolata.AAC.2